MKCNEDISNQALEVMKVVSDNITLARKSRNLSQEEVAKACNIGVGTYAAVERGELSPGMRAYLKVADFYGVSSSFIFMFAPQIDTTGRSLRLR